MSLSIQISPISKDLQKYWNSSNYLKVKCCKCKQNFQAHQHCNHQTFSRVNPENEWRPTFSKCSKHKNHKLVGNICIDCGSDNFEIYSDCSWQCRNCKRIKNLKQKSEQDKIKIEQLQKRIQALQLEQEVKSISSYSSLSSKSEMRIKDLYTCPITGQIMEQPADLPCQHCFQKLQIQKWIQKQGNCPLCRQKFEKKDIRKNRLVKQSIQEFLEKLKRKEIKKQQ